ncbi:Zn-ribbon domain-containing OB-fold protein [Gilvimarinus sp. F26214L]|uniref:Zn-ribbon domain-containing OB-fold protein n=1 Tax=Gilvimarinus sp. DZF01 TaxID=3461371 RepID=UPI00404583CF
MTQSDLQTFADEGPDKQYAGYLAQGQFRIQQCKSCGRHVFYPRLICPHCGGPELDWVTPSGEGVVYSTSTPRGGPDGDYNISLIDLAEGPRMMSRVVDVDPGQVRIGMRVQGFIGEIEGRTVVLFRPAEGQS